MDTLKLIVFLGEVIFLSVCFVKLGSPIPSCGPIWADDGDHDDSLNVNLLNI